MGRDSKYMKQKQTCKKKEIHNYRLEFQISVIERMNRKSNVAFLVCPTLTINFNYNPSLPAHLSCTHHLLTKYLF